jgi:type IV pilus assembly protein PilV
MKPLTSSRLLNKKDSQKGFTLLEVLIALLVLSIGLLGLAGLEIFGLKYNFQSYERTQATLLITEMADRMRANPEGVRANAYDAVAIAAAAPASVNCADPAIDCSSGTVLADYDIAQWKTGLSAPKMLAQGQGGITRLATTLVSGIPIFLFEIEVRWMEDQINMSQTMNVQVLP